MAITAIQPITNFSTILPATAVAPQEVVSIASDFVTTPTASAVVTLGTAQHVSQPLFDSTGQLVSPGSFSQTPQSQALADELASALNSATAGNASNTNAAAALANLEFEQFMFEMSLLNSSSLIGGNLLNAGLGTGATTDFSGVLATQVELAIAGIGTGSGANAASGALSPNAIAIQNTPATAPATPTTIATTPANAVAPPATVAPAIAPPAIAPTAAVPAATVPAATAPPATIAPLTTAAPAATTAVPAAGTGAGTTTAAPGNTPAEVLQRLVADVTGRAAANLIDPGFAATSASLFASAAIFRAANATPDMGTADTAAVPPPEVTAAQPARAV